MLAQRARKLVGISPRAWEHPADRAALQALHQLSGFDQLLKTLVGGTTERSIRLLHLSSCVKVTPSQFHRVRVLLERVVDVMDWPDLPDVFVANNPFFNAGVYGVSTPFIVLNSSVLRALSDDELYCVIGHEVGHIMSGHALYKTLIWMLLAMSSAALPVPRMLLRALVLALKEWDRKSELTADRAGLLALQSESESYAVLMKMAGGEDLSQMSINDFFQQAMEYEGQKGLLDGFFKVLNTANQSHPASVVRLMELRTWASGGQYRAILDGNYPRREHTAQDVREDVKEGFEHYRSSVQEGGQALRETVRNAGQSLGKAAQELGRILKDAMGQQGKGE